MPARKQASRHSHNLTLKQCVSYDLASGYVGYVKQGDIYRRARELRDELWKGKSTGRGDWI